MAVTKSNGNGYSLYNGIKLPSLPEWDKTAYPYALMATWGLAIGLVLYADRPTHGTNPDNESQTGIFCNCAYKLYLYSDGDDGWIFDSETSGATAIVDNQLPVIWTNTDIIQEDSNVYFAASDPICLDGMKIIEWDGDTTGLTSSNDGLFWKISNINISRDEFLGSVCSVSLDKTVLGAEVMSEDAIETGSDYVYASAIVSIENGTSINGVEFEKTGLYFLREQTDEGFGFINLFAYVPKPIPPLSLNPTSMLIGWLLGRRIAKQRCNKEEKINIDTLAASFDPLTAQLIMGKSGTLNVPGAIIGHTGQSIYYKNGHLIVEDETNGE